MRLEYYAANLFDTVELNASYYRWPALTSFERWHRRLPDGFRMTVKAPKGLTHVGHLTALDEWLPHITPALDALGDRLGLFLVQLPPTLNATMRCSTPSSPRCRAASTSPSNSATTVGSTTGSSRCLVHERT